MSRRASGSEKCQSDPTSMFFITKLPSSSETEDEYRPDVKSYAVGPSVKQDSDTEKNIAQAEEMSSFSEQAWDNYQVRLIRNLLPKLVIFIMTKMALLFHSW